MPPSSAFDVWVMRAREAPIDAVAERLGAKLKKLSSSKAGTEYAGPCPRCGGDDRFAINTRKRLFNCRGAVGGNVIGMVEHVLGLDFIAACEWIVGEPPPDRERALTDDDRAKLEKLAAERQANDQKRESDDNAFRARERRTLYDIWRVADPDAPELADYLALRLGPLFASLPRELRPRLRLVRDMPYYRGGGDRGDILACAPAMVAPLVDTAGKFRALHFTYLDLAAPEGKLRIFDPDKPNELLTAKKMRGSKKGHWIELCRPASEVARQMILGEGIEKTAAVWLALRLDGRDLSATAAWVACDLGNLGGKAAYTVRHPTRRHEKSGRPVMVGGPEPDLASPAIVIPDSVEDLVLLGDSTSDRFETERALARASRRYERAGRAVRVAWQPDGADFDDVIREAA